MNCVALQPLPYDFDTISITGQSQKWTVNSTPHKLHDIVNVMKFREKKIFSTFPMNTFIHTNTLIQYIKLNVCVCGFLFVCFTDETIILIIKWSKSFVYGKKIDAPLLITPIKKSNNENLCVEHFERYIPDFQNFTLEYETVNTK